MNKIGISMTTVKRSEIKNFVSNNILTTLAKKSFEEARYRCPESF